mmetsp:Transcript_36886/g.75597  ORF Transcript_36886/g.75597 Transcript_36886/m.75597 type:complete len:119 (-) Transcript_36886:253-609(-)
MRMCALVSIIKKWARGKPSTKHTQAWKLADNSIVAASRTNTMLNLTIVNNAIALAQRHLDREDEDEEEETQTLKTEESTELADLKSQLAKAQQSIQALQAGANNLPTKGKQPEGNATP